MSNTYNTTELCYNALDQAFSEKSRLEQLLAINATKLQNIYTQLGKHTHNKHKAAQAPKPFFGFAAASLPSAALVPPPANPASGGFASPAPAALAAPAPPQLSRAVLTFGANGADAAPFGAPANVEDAARAAVLAKMNGRKRPVRAAPAPAAKRRRQDSE